MEEESQAGCWEVYVSPQQPVSQSLKGVIVLLAVWGDLLIDILNYNIYVLNMYLKNDWFSIYGSNTKFPFKSIFLF